MHWLIVWVAPIVAEGFTRLQDVLPPKLAKPRRGGASDGVFVPRAELEQAKDLYYSMGGWDSQGVPTRPKLLELGLGWVADEIGA